MLHFEQVPSCGSGDHSMRTTGLKGSSLDSQGVSDANLNTLLSRASLALYFLLLQ